MFKNNYGLSLLEIMIAVAVLGAVSLGVMNLLQNMQQGQNEMTTTADYLDMRREAVSILTAQESCSASIAGTVFNGSSIQLTPVNNLELWTVSTTGTRSRMVLAVGSKYVKLNISEISFTIPDHLTAANWPVGTNQTALADIKIAGTRTNLGKTRPFKDIIIKTRLTFDTNASGTSTITSCSDPSSNSPNDTITTNCVISPPANTNDAPVNFNCPGNSFIAGTYSDHNNSTEDRIYRFGCCDIYKNGIQLTKGSCQNFPNVNGFDSPVQFTCPADMYLSGEASIHSNSAEDRRYSFTCCQALYQGVVPPKIKAGRSGVANEFDFPVRFECPDGKLLNQVESYHSNDREDRVFYFGCAGPR